MTDQENKIISMYNEISEKYDKQIQRIHSTYKWLGSLISVIIIAGGVFFWINTSDLKKSYEAAIDPMKKNLETEISLSKREMQSKIDEIFHNNKNVINERIEKEFSSEAINLLVEEVARRRMKEIADEVISKIIQNKISPQIEVVDDKLTAMYDNSKMSIEVLEFNLYKTMALSDNRFAFEKIYEWSVDSKSTFQKDAVKAIGDITREYKDAIFYSLGSFTLQTSGERIDYLSVDETNKKFWGAPREEKINLLELMNKNPNIDKKDKAKFYLSIIKNDQSLKVVTTATKILLKAYELKLGYLELDKIISWGENNL